MRKILSSFLVLCVTLSLLAIAPRKVNADGMVVSPYIYPVISSRQQALIIYENGREDLVISINFEGRASDFGWIVPLPNQPEISKVDASIFRKLQDLTVPKESLLDKLKGNGNVITYGYGSAEVDLAAPQGEKSTVTVLEENSIGIFDYAILQTENPDDLHKWMQENDYNLPSAIETQNGEFHNVQPIKPSEDRVWLDALPIVQDYIDSGWYFVTIKINNSFVGSTGVATELEKGAVDPLRFSFDTTDMIYPMKLTSLGKRSTSVLLYVIDDHKVKAENYNNSYCFDTDDCSLFDTSYASEITKDDIADLTKEIGKGSWFESSDDMIITKLYAYAIPSDKMTEEILFEDTENNQGVNDGSMTLGEWVILPLVLVLYVPFWLFGGGVAGEMFYDDYGFLWFAVAVLFFSLLSLGWIGFSIYLLKHTKKRLKRVILYALQFPAVSFVALGVSLLVAIPFAMGISALDLNEEATMVDGICCFAFVLALAPVLFYRMLWKRRTASVARTKTIPTTKKARG